MWVRYKEKDKNSMKYEVKEEYADVYDLSMIGIRQKDLFEECSKDEEIPDIVDVYCYLANNGKIK